MPLNMFYHVLRLEDTGMTQKGKNLLAEVCKPREDLDINFIHHSQVLQKKNAKRATWDLLMFAAPAIGKCS